MIENVSEPTVAANLSEITDLKVLQNILGEAIQGKNWPRVVDVVQRMVDLESSPKKKAQYFYTVASVQNTQTINVEKALENFERVLDYNPSELRAFIKINEILTARRDWVPLAQSYRRLLERTGAPPTDQTFNLWRALGTLYRDRLNDKTNAIEALSAALQIRQDSEVSQILQELQNS